MSDREAYRKAYPKREGWSDEEVDRAVFKFMNNDRFLKRFEFVSEEYTKKNCKNKSEKENSCKDVVVDKNGKNTVKNVVNFNSKDNIEQENFFTKKEATNKLKWIVNKAVQDLKENGFKQASSSAFFNAMKLLIEIEGLKPDTMAKIDKTKADTEKAYVEIRKLKGIAEEIEDLSDIEKEIYEED
ncbi:hypothetical protein LJC13_00650 [Peptostreptococcaceae bacterium OttesenSCG-928-C18]|nr:hypothetical protein [Peptostreptococcaceae bacterium OttesenSCG-928-C18]